MTEHMRNRIIGWSVALIVAGLIWFGLYLWAMAVIRAMS